MERYYEKGLEFALNKDKDDPLKSFRDRFYIPEDTIYMDGNSLGLASVDAIKHLNILVEAWKTHGIELLNLNDNKYFLYQDLIGEKMAKIVGADPIEVTCMANTTLNIHSAISTFYKPTESRYKILVDELNFPTDLYAVDGQVMLKGYTPEEAVKEIKSTDGMTLSEDAIIDAMTDDVAIILLANVLYRSGQVLNMERISKAARDRGIIIGWDMSHGIGSVEIDLNAAQADFAVWCTYKYLSGGPGSIAGFYINKKHLSLYPGLPGWQGNRKDTQFLMRRTFEPNNSNAGGWQTGSRSLLSMSTLEGTLDIFDDAGMPNIRKKSLDMTGYLMYLIDEDLKEYGYTIGNLRDDDKRGGHVCVVHEEAYRITKALKDQRVIPDYREPNIIRIAPVALYNTYEEVYQVAEILKDIVKNKKYEDISKDRTLVV